MDDGNPERIKTPPFNFFRFGFSSLDVERPSSRELVFIGQNMNEVAITAALNDCLVTRQEAAFVRSGGVAGGGEYAYGASLRREEWKLRLDGIVHPEDDPFPEWPSSFELDDANGAGGHHRGHDHGHAH